MIRSDKINHRTGEVKLKTNVVILYNKNMGGVDLFDQPIHTYECIRKSMKWDIKVYFDLFDISIFNAITVYNIFHPKAKKSLLEFRM